MITGLWCVCDPSQKIIAIYALSVPKSNKNVIFYIPHKNAPREKEIK